MDIKEKFLSETWFDYLYALNGTEKPLWGKLSAQGMIEHMVDSVAIAYGKQVHALQTPPEMIEKAKAFAMSDKEFKPNTKNSLMGDEPAPLRHENIKDAIQELHQEVSSFFTFYHNYPQAIVTNPFFGDMNYKEWLHLLYKHARHHLKQFGLIE
ncbi:MAG: DUF1569 domain-containing protein [Flavobacteriales bacterium]|nr:DUF1569 domain-containing protein [Flavobacteriales bacterium]